MPVILRTRIAFPRLTRLARLHLPGIVMKTGRKLHTEKMTEFRYSGRILYGFRI